MGMSRLKIKDEIRYRKGSSSECSGCNHFIPHVRIRGIGGVDLGRHPRCRIIGLDSSTRYQIRPDHVCDRFDSSLKLLSLMGEARYRETWGEEKLQETLGKRAGLERCLAELKAKGMIV